MQRTIAFSPRARRRSSVNLKNGGFHRFATRSVAPAAGMGRPVMRLF
jgi:hypothetical protein